MKVTIKITTLILISNIINIYSQSCGKSNPASEQDCYDGSTSTLGCCYLTALNITETPSAVPKCKSYDYKTYPKIVDYDNLVIYTVKCPIQNNPFYYLLPCQFNVTIQSPIQKLPLCNLYNEAMNYCCRTWSNSFADQNCFYSNTTLDGNFTKKQMGYDVNFECMKSNFLNALYYIFVVIVVYLF